VLRLDPKLLIVVERVIWPMRGLGPYAEALLPRFKDRLVLGAHHYSWNGPGRYLAFGHMMTAGWQGHTKPLLRALRVFSRQNYGDMSLECLREEVRGQWGALLEAETCPVWISEFGACSGGYDWEWFEKFVEVLGELDADYAYWPLNAGPKPGCGGGEPYGLLGADFAPKPEGDCRVDLMVKHGLLPKAAPAS